MHLAEVDHIAALLSSYRASWQVNGSNAVHQVIAKVQKVEGRQGLESGRSDPCFLFFLLFLLIYDLMWFNLLFGDINSDS